MEQKILDFSSLKNAIAALERVMKVFRKNSDVNKADFDIDVYEGLRSGVIQNFEVAYELSWKSMKRWLETNVSPDIADGLTRHEFYRKAAENKLIDDVEAWWDFHDARNSTSHVYDGVMAEDVADTAARFLPQAKELLVRLEKNGAE
jgi:nucleotidyltransferase substrate binding protein (TIGR01987 family)